LSILGGTAASTITLGAAAHSVTGGTAADTVVVPAVAATGKLDGGASAANTLSVADGTDISGATVSNFAALTFAAATSTTADLTLKAAQHALFSGTVTATGTSTAGEKITITDAFTGTGLAAVENYVLNAASTFTLGAAAQNVTGSTAADTVIVPAATTATGTIDGGATGTNTLSVGDGADISGATVSNFANLTFAAATTGTADLILKAAQHALFSGTVTAAGAAGAGEEITITDAFTGTGFAAVENYVLNAASTFTLGAAAQNVTVAANLAHTVNVASLTPTGFVTGLDAGDTVAMTTGANIASLKPSSGGSAGAATGADTATLVGAATMTIAQHDGFTIFTANGSSDAIVISDAAAGAVTAKSSVESYTVAGTSDVTVHASKLGVNITGDVAAQTVTVGGGTVTGTYALGGTGTDVISTTDGANIAGVNAGAATTAETLNFVGGVTMTAAQLDGFTSLVGTTSPAITLTTAITAAMLDNAVIGSTTDISIVLANVASNAITAAAATLGTSGDVLTIDGSNLTGTNALTFIGTNETDGKFIVQGGAAADAITAGSGGDVITGNGGNDAITASAGTSVTTIVFGASAVLNGADTITGFEAGTSATDSDILDFRAFVTGRLVDAGGSANTGSTAVTEFSTASTGEESISNKVVVFGNGGTALTATTLAAEFANGTAAAGSTAAFADLNVAFKAVVIEGNVAGSAAGKIWYVDSALDGTATDVTAADIVLVGTLSTNIDIDAITGNQIL
jgi:hypothetical protein